MIANLGGIANITDLPPRGDVRGFDTGPGNVLLDLWHARHRGGPFDADGAFAASGHGRAHRCCERMLARALLRRAAAQEHGARPVQRGVARPGHRGSADSRARAQDVQATLAALTARTLADAIRAHCPGAEELLVCGGGANNADLMRRLGAELPRRRRSRRPSASAWRADHVEALAFAWLAREATRRAAGQPAGSHRRARARACSARSIRA